MMVLLLFIRKQVRCDFDNIFRYLIFAVFCLKETKSVRIPLCLTAQIV